MMATYIVNGKCPSCEQLEQLAFGKMPMCEQQEMLDHISNCRECRDIYEAFKEADPVSVDAAEREIGSRIDARISQLRSGKSSGRVIKLVAKCAAAASIVGLGIWAVNNMDTGKSVMDDNAVAYTDFEGKADDAVDVSDAGNIEAPSRMSMNISDRKCDVHNDDNTPVIRAAESGSEVLTCGGAASTVIPQAQVPKTKVDNAMVSAMLNDASQLIVKGEYLDAKDIVEDALNQDPDNNKGLRLMGICNLNLKYYSNAISCFRKVKPATKAEAEQIANYIKECEDHLK